MTSQARQRRANGGVCARCGSPRAPRRRVYCGDACYQAAHAEQQRKTREGRQLANCLRCGGPKEGGVRGAKYCAECRRLVADQASAYEAERTRRKVLERRAEKMRSGNLRYHPDAPDGQKWCARCQSFRPLSSFPTTKRRVGAWCRPCTRSYNAERRLKIKFGLTWDEYDAIYQAQGGRCAICGGKPRAYMLAVDHDHKTGEVRGLLCSRCNHRLLGSANDDPARLRKAADYLEAFQPREQLGRRHIIPGFPKEDR